MKMWSVHWRPISIAKTFIIYLFPLDAHILISRDLSTTWSHNLQGYSLNMQCNAFVSRLCVLLRCRNLFGSTITQQNLPRIFYRRILTDDGVAWRCLKLQEFCVIPSHKIPVSNITDTKQCSQLSFPFKIKFSIKYDSYEFLKVGANRACLNV